MFKRCLIRINTKCLSAFLGLTICYLLILLISYDKNLRVFVKYVPQIVDRLVLTKDTSPLTDIELLQSECTITNTEEIESFFGRIKSNLSTWTFRSRVKCDKHGIGETFAFRRRRMMSIQCSERVAHVTYSETMNSSDVYSLTEKDDECLRTFLQTCCGPDHRVPNVVHYVWYLRGKLTFTSFLSILSVVRFIKPCAIIFHGEIPFGSYWDAITYFYPNFIHLKRERPTSIFGINITTKTHSSDIMRIEALSKYGGIYLDMDTVMVRPVDILMDYSCVMSNISSGVFASAFIMSEPNAKFLQLWLNEYKTDYKPHEYVYNAMVVPTRLAVKKENKHLIHVEHATISCPRGMLRGKIFNETYATHDWSYMYGLHTYIHNYRAVVNETTIRNMNSTFGSVCRHIFYGDKELCM